ncbi:uncharacterized protein FIBRA_05069 [Fibroporia radiculosa]|uniref:Mitochondrial carrier n=1 Tax=Fibroporia radiculosa TaxID=599839 RepID=J4H3A9_9APHY|nr:uncharacterized protein FIBRA_05069 [Fibroporia radiculosa]CCM02954.1 predicted protein [Fibroporia radiculosa]
MHTSARFPKPNSSTPSDDLLPPPSRSSMLRCARKRVSERHLIPAGPCRDEGANEQKSASSWYESLLPDIQLIDSQTTDLCGTLHILRHIFHTRGVPATLRKALISPTAPSLLGGPTELAIGFIAGVASRAISTPLSVVTVRLQSSGDDDDAILADSKVKQQKRTWSATDVIRDVYQEQGLGGFWAGFIPALPLALTPALSLLFFKILNRMHFPLLPTTTATPARAALRAFLDGACSNALALALLYPVVLAKVRVQAWRPTLQEGASRGATTMMDVWRTALTQRGCAGLYDGLGAQIVKGFVNQGVTMMVKQRIEQALVRLYVRG